MVNLQSFKAVSAVFSTPLTRLGCVSGVLNSVFFAIFVKKVVHESETPLAECFLILNQTCLLSKKTKYAVNALVYMAKNEKREPISARQISEARNIPLKFLESILGQLKSVRVVKSKKGKNGGYSINGQPGDVNMATITRLFDGAIALLPCATHKYYERCEECIDEATCGIRQITMEIRNETVERLKAATLADIIEREDRLAQSQPKADKH